MLLVYLEKNAGFIFVVIEKYGLQSWNDSGYAFRWQKKNIWNEMEVKLGMMNILLEWIPGNFFVCARKLFAWHLV